MKAEGRFAYRFLEKVIQSCELANGLANSMLSLSRRDLKLSCTQLQEKGHVLPHSMRLVLSKKIVSFLSQDLVDTLKVKDAAERKKKQQPMVEQLIGVLSVWTCCDEKDGWTFANPSFAVLAAEHQADLQVDTSEAMDVDAGEDAERLARSKMMNEAEHSKVQCQNTQ